MPSSSRDHRADVRRVFVLGTGRSGTRTVADWLSGIEGCCVAHEAKPKLLEEVSEYLDGARTRDEMVRLLAETRSAAALGGERLSGESNQRLSFALDALNEAFGDARYIWVIRDGRDTVASLHHRRWYHPHEAVLRPVELEGWVKHRVRADVVGECDTREWDRWSAFERCCWYWSYTNRLIEAQRQKLGLEMFSVRLEDLEDRSEALLSFLGLEGVETDGVPRSNASTRHGGGVLNRPAPWRMWSAHQRRRFEALAGSVMDQWYPAWRQQKAVGVMDRIRGAAYRCARGAHDLLTRARRGVFGRGDQARGG